MESGACSSSRSVAAAVREQPRAVLDAQFQPGRAAGFVRVTGFHGGNDDDQRTHPSADQRADGIREARSLPVLENRIRELGVVTECALDHLPKLSGPLR